MEPSDFFVLNRCNWQFFATLTFKNEVSVTVQNKMMFAFLREVARKFGIHFHELLWVSRRERGETFGRLHLHLLIGGASPNWCNIATCFTLMRSWESIGGGMARIHLFNASLNAGDYLLKPESFTGSEAYESGKFGSEHVELTFAHAVCQKWHRRRDIHAKRLV